MCLNNILMQAPLARKKQYVSIRNEVKADKQTDDEDGYTGYSSSVNLASQYLADSSLSEDFHQYDFSATSQVRWYSLVTGKMVLTGHR